MEINKVSGLTKQEEEIAEDILKVHHRYLGLPKQHPSDIDEWITGIHILQGLLMQRIARRLYPQYWKNDEK